MLGFPLQNTTALEFKLQKGVFSQLWSLVIRDEGVGREFPVRLTAGIEVSHLLTESSHCPFLSVCNSLLSLCSQISSFDMHAIGLFRAHHVITFNCQKL